MPKQLRHEKHAEAAEGVARRQGRTAVVVALLTSVVAAAAKVGAAIVTGSTAMLATAVHSGADAGSQALLLIGGRRSKRAGAEEHPLGYGRDRYFWSLVVGVALFGVGSGASVYEGLRTLDRPEVLTDPSWAFGALGIGLVANALALRTATRQADHVRGEAGYGQLVRRARAPELPVVLIEGLGALVGLAVALAGVTATVVTDDGRWDAWAALAIGVLLGLLAVVLVWELKSLLIGESAARKDVEAIRGAIEVEPDVLRILTLTTQHIGPGEVLVGARVEFQHELSVAEVASTIDRVERTIRAGVPSARTIYLEPDVGPEHRVHGFVEDHVGHIDPDDPAYQEITGHRPEGDDEPIWS